MPSFYHTYRTPRGGERIDGVFAMAFIHNGDTFYLTHVSIYKDGMVDCWGLRTFAEFVEAVHPGWVVTQPPANAKVSVSFLGDFTAAKATYYIESEDFIREVADEIEALNGRPTTSDLCRAALVTYEASPSEGAKEALRAAYDAVPAHNRIFLGDMDTKDNDIRRILFPDEYEEWDEEAKS